MLLAPHVRVDSPSGNSRRPSSRLSWVAWALLLLGVTGVVLLSVTRRHHISRPPQEDRQTPSPSRADTILPETGDAELQKEQAAKSRETGRREPLITPPDSTAQQKPSARFFRERLTSDARRGSSPADTVWRTGFPQLLEAVEPSITTPHRLVWILPDQTAVIYDRDADRYRQVDELSADEVSLMDDLDRIQSMQQLDRLQSFSPTRRLPER